MLGFSNISGKNKSEPRLLRRESIKDSNLLLIITIGTFVFLYGISIILASARIGGFGNLFLSAQGIFELFNSNAWLILFVCGLSMVMIGGGIDISVAGVAVTAGVTGATLLNSGWSPFGVLIIAMFIGLAFGVLQGYLIAYLKIQPFIVTLTGMFLGRGIATLISVNSVNIVNSAFDKWVSWRLFGPSGGDGLRMGALFAILAILLAFIILRWTKFGRNLYAVGGNSQNALTLGINVNRTKFYSYVFCGLLASIGGFFALFNSRTAGSDRLTGLEMQAIAACIIGGILLTGGVGNIWGALFGVLSVGMIKLMVPRFGTVISFMREEWAPGMVLGLVLLVFIVLQSIILGYRNRKRMGIIKTTANTE